MQQKAESLRSRLGLVTPEDLAAALDVSVDTLREWRRLKQGPDFVKTGKSVMYREIDVQEWLERNVVPVIRNLSVMMFALMMPAQNALQWLSEVI
jgi:predicted DNA-binding transcriptional regulator AlpA